jgi:hypothetical protein
MGERGKSQGVGSCYQTGDKGGWGFVTTSKELALQVRKCNMGLLYLAIVSILWELLYICRYRDT